MNKNRDLGVGIILLAIGILGVMLTPSVHHTMMGLVQGISNIHLPKGISKSTLPDSQSHEAKLVVRFCAQCHELPAPGMHTHAEWPLVINRMKQYMRTMHTLHVNRPSDQEMQSILDYLTKHAQIAINRSEYDDLNSPAGMTFYKTCSQCHAAPEPKQHYKNEWPHVVQRMQENMHNMGIPFPDNKELELIINYLQQHASEE